jgi:glycosyltransferase involved in cell wall biosynthesis
MRVIACNSPYGQGGIGQHFAHLVEDSRREGALDRYYTTRPKSGDDKGRELEKRWWEQALLRYTPLRFSPAWKTHVTNELFDRRLAARLTGPRRFMGFAGTALHSFRRAAELNAEHLELVAPNSHVNALVRSHRKAARQFDFESSWMNDAQRRKTVREYERADEIYVHSRYVRRSFIEEGVSPAKLRRMRLGVDARFEPPTVRPADDVFRVVYVGRLVATKGVPLLLKAFAHLSSEQAELTLVGGWSTRRMRQHVQGWMERDPRIRVAPGDPLPALQRADVFVYPTYSDGFGYAPMEALACGTPVIVTEDTGMKEHVVDGENGYVVPTGRWEALLERMEHVRRHPLAWTQADERENALAH